MAFNIRGIIGRNRAASQPTGASLSRITPTGDSSLDYHLARNTIEQSGLSQGDIRRGINPSGGGLNVSDWDRKAGFIHPDQKPSTGMIKPSQLKDKQQSETARARLENRPARDMKRAVDPGRPQGSSNTYFNSK